MGHRLNCPCAIAQGVPTPMYPAAPIQSRSHATAPGSSPLSVRLGIWSGWVVKEDNACQNAYVPESQQDEKKRKNGKKGTCAGWAWPYNVHRTIYWVRWWIADPPGSLPLLASSRQEGAATGTSQAGSFTDLGWKMELFYLRWNLLSILTLCGFECFSVHYTMNICESNPSIII